MCIGSRPVATLENRVSWRHQRKLGGSRAIWRGTQQRELGGGAAEETGEWSGDPPQGELEAAEGELGDHPRSRVRRGCRGS